MARLESQVQARAEIAYELVQGNSHGCHIATGAAVGAELGLVDAKRDVVQGSCGMLLAEQHESWSSRRRHCEA